MRRLGLLAALAVCLLAAGAPAALAHEGNADYRSVIDRVTPSVPGVELEVRDYDSHMELVDRGHEVVVYGYEGESYARVLADGTVQVNQRSPSTYLNEDRFADVEVPESADPATAPVWETIDDSGTFTWHDHRMHYMSTGLPPQVKDEGEETVVFDYRIPISVDGERGAIAGTLYWVGPADTSKLPFLVAGTAVVLLGALAVLLIRRRRSGGEDGPQPEVKEAW